jgi:uncharacterized hydrophobic protein (TIGR00341 family)
MSLRLMELIVPTDTVEDIEQILSEQNVIDHWKLDLAEHESNFRILLPTEHTEKISDLLSSHFSHEKNFRITLFTVEATLPKPEETESKKALEEEKIEEETGRISREELYNDVLEGARLSYDYIIMVILSSIVAAVGLIRNDVAVIIGAMVIAPLLGPNVGLSLAATLGDIQLAIHSLKTNIAGLLTSFLIAVIAGLLLHIDPNVSEIANRTTLNIGDVLIALAAGSAGVLAYTRGVPAVIIGVMVAVALLPPLVTTGLLAGAGYFMLATGALLLTITNLTCLNLAGVITFIAQGIRPRTWWEAEKAKKAIRNAILFWVSLLIILLLIIYFRF